MTYNLLNHQGYFGSVETDLAEGHLYGQVLFTVDHISYHGDTVAELKQAFVEAVDEYLADCQNLGKEPEKTLKGSLNVRLGPLRHRSLALKGRQTQKSINQLICDAVDGFLAAPAKETHIHNSFEVKLERPFNTDITHQSFRVPQVRSKKAH
jgi:predicted HicB family RNase H-like nuclease